MLPTHPAQSVLRSAGHGMLTGAAVGPCCTPWAPQRPRSSQLQKRRAAAAALADGGPGGEPPQQPPQAQQQQQQQQPEFDIVSGSRVPEAQGPSCDWPRLEERQRFHLQDSALMTTGFPVPAGYGSGGVNLPPANGSGVLWRLRNPERQPSGPVRGAAAAAAAAAGPGSARGVAGGRQQVPLAGRSATAGATGSSGGGRGLGPPLVPVFRAAPYSAEAARQRRPSPTARILFLDDGCSCRAVLAQALLQTMLSKLPRPLDADVHAASIGPPAPGGHDERVVAVAKEMDITLPPRRAREFDEMRDTPAFDLILVMDQYDRQEVVREVSVLERLNPGGAYLTRVQRLNRFARAGQLVLKDRCLLVPEDVPDPFYGVVSPAAEQASLRRTVHSIALGCRGLLSYLLKLKARCGTGAATVPLRVALAQSLQCPLLDPTSHHALSALIHCQLAPAQLATWQQEQQQQKEGRQRGAASGGAGEVGGTARAPAAGSSGNGSSGDADWAAHIRSWPRPVWLGSRNGSDDEEGQGEQFGSAAQRPLWTVREVAGQRVVVRRPRADETQAPRGYWNSIENVELELSKWMELHGQEGRLPTQRELRRSGANTLSAKVDTHGGLAVFGERMGLQLASGRMPNGQRSDFGKVAAELRRFVEAQQAAQQQAAAQQPAAVQPNAEAEEGQQQQQQGQARQPPWQAGAASSAAAASGNALGSTDSSMAGAPRRVMRFASRSWSSSGRGAAGAQRLGLPAVTMLAEDGSAAGSSSGNSSSPGSGASNGEPIPNSGDSGSSSSTSGGSSIGELVFLPTQQELRAAGRADLIGAIRAHGGSLAVARRLGWAVHHGRLPSEAAVVAQLLEFAEQEDREQGGRGAGRGARGRRTAAVLPMPSLRQLEEGGRVDLAGAVQRLGGVQAFAALLAAEQERRRGSRRGKQQGGEAEAEAAQGQRQQEGSQSAAAAESQQRQLSQILTYASGSRDTRLARQPTPPQPAVVKVGQSVVQLIEARGWERRVPTKQELLAAGRRDLHVAITRCGGAQKLAEHLQLPYAETRGRRKRAELQAQDVVGQGGPEEGPAGRIQLELQPSFLAARLRQPPGMAAVPSQAGSTGSAAAAGLSATAGGGRQAASPKRPQGPASRLMERELVLEAYEDVTFV